MNVWPVHGWILALSLYYTLSNDLGTFPRWITPITKYKYHRHFLKDLGLSLVG